MSDSSLKFSNARSMATGPTQMNSPMYGTVCYVPTFFWRHVSVTQTKMGKVRNVFQTTWVWMSRMFLEDVSVNMFSCFNGNPLFVCFKQILSWCRHEWHEPIVSHAWNIYLMKHDIFYVLCMYQTGLDTFQRLSMTKQMMIFMLRAAVWRGGWVPIYTHRASLFIPALSLRSPSLFLGGKTLAQWCLVDTTLWQWSKTVGMPKVYAIIIPLKIK